MGIRINNYTLYKSLFLASSLLISSCSRKNEDISDKLKGEKTPKSITAQTESHKEVIPKNTPEPVNYNTNYVSPCLIEGKVAPISPGQRYYHQLEERILSEASFIALSGTNEFMTEDSIDGRSRIAYNGKLNFTPKFLGTDKENIFGFGDYLLVKPGVVEIAHFSTNNEESFIIQKIDRGEILFMGTIDSIIEYITIEDIQKKRFILRNVYELNQEKNEFELMESRPIISGEFRQFLDLVEETRKKYSPSIK